MGSMKNLPQTKSKPPIVLCFSGHDPSGGAGIQADIETLQALDCLPATIITCLTAQNSRNVERIASVSPDLIRQQLECLGADYQFDAIKIGLLGFEEIVDIVIQFVDQVPGIPVVLDPVLAAGGGKGLVSERLRERIYEGLIPKCTLITPNSPEARRLTGEASLDSCAINLLDKGVKSVLITGTHEDTDQVSNTLYRPNHTPDSLSWARLPYSYHGSGCTFASACAASLAHGLDLTTACMEAQLFTWEALNNGWQPGHGQHIPHRHYDRTQKHEE